MIDVRCPLCKNYCSCKKIGMIPFENCGMFVIDNTIKRHKTNADRIRSMDNYDLAIFLENVSCKHANTESWLDWLRQEASND